jgi:hypothetical protein
MTRDMLYIVVLVLYRIELLRSYYCTAGQYVPSRYTTASRILVRNIDGDIISPQIQGP